MSKLVILTLSWNGANKLTKLKNSLIPALQGLEYEWHIKDNGSTDNTLQEFSKWDESINANLISYKDNRQNFAAGVNYLFDVAVPKEDDLIMLLNNDVVFNDTASIHKMLHILQQDANVGVVGSRLLYTGSNKIQHAGVVFDPTYKTPMHFRAGETSDANAEKNREFQAMTAAAMITRADLFRQVSKNPSGIVGLDEQYHWAFDDTDYCLSVKYNLGKKIVYCGQTNIFHEESATLKKNPVNRMFLQHNLKYFFNKWKGRYMIDREQYTNNPNLNLYTEQ